MPHTAQLERSLPNESGRGSLPSDAKGIGCLDCLSASSSYSSDEWRCGCSADNNRSEFTVSVLEAGWDLWPGSGLDHLLVACGPRRDDPRVSITHITSPRCGVDCARCYRGSEPGA